MVGIREFYSGKSVFLTGVTGLVGKLVLEKLLRSCGDVHKVYVLVRVKRGKEAQQRIRDVFDIPAFGPLKKQREDFPRKIVVVQGDLEDGNLEIDAQILDDIDFVIHCAATVRFNETLKKATAINVRGTKQVLELARKMRKLKAFVHVSTAFSFCPNEEIDEILYEAPIEADGLITTTQILGDDLLADFERSVIKKWPNTYTFTKGVAENLLLNYKDLPIAVVRPSILLGSFKEPLPGWIDNLMGVSGIMIGIGVGVIRIFTINPDLVTDLLPVDYAVNLILAAGWDVGNTRNGQRESGALTIFNCVSSIDAPITWYELRKYSYPMARDFTPSRNALWYPFCFFVASKTVYNTFKLFLHLLPGYILDFFAARAGRKERLGKIYKKIDDASNTLIYFTTNEWKFKNDNAKRLWAKMSDDDRKTFYFDMEGFDWKCAIANVCVGLRCYVEKEPNETIEDGKRRISRLKVAHYLVVGLLLLFLYRLLVSIFT